jgi:hypothetical protein
MAELDVPKSMPSVPAGEEVMKMKQKPTVAMQAHAMTGRV